MLVIDVHRDHLKIIFRHSSLSTTERYLGKISDVEAMKWIDNLYG
jgi:integrase/recombinase XerD